MAFNPKKFALVGSIAANRGLHKSLYAPVQKVACSIGEVVVASNACHAAFHMFFCSLIHPQNGRVGHAIWHTLFSDSMQRDVMLATAEVVLAKNKKLLRRIKWAKRAADALSLVRNDAVHMAPAFTVTKKPELGLMHSRLHQSGLPASKTSIFLDVLNP